jgi:phosphoglucomutase
MQIDIISTSPIEGQKTGTSGLRKKVRHIQSHPLYIENWIQSLMNALDNSQDGSTFVVGGDGRYMNETAVIAVIEILAANGIDRVIVGQGGLLSTPAVSNLIRLRSVFGGIIMTASHNPAGIDGDWGIKFNCSNGEPAPEKITDKIYDESQQIRVIQRPRLGLKFQDLTSVGTKKFSGTKFTVEIVDPVSDYIESLKGIFDFPRLATFFRQGPPIVFDGMHAVTGIYAKKIFVDELGLSSVRLINCIPAPDFNGGHPDPNLVYAHDLVNLMMSGDKCQFMLGAASDGDGDRNMIMGNNWFVTPSDSLAIIADFAIRGAIPYFNRVGLKGVARSMPTSRAVDVVCRANNIACFETPTGWKYFGNLMDGGLANLCGEESFGTGSDHIREKDGIWAIMAWLTILEYANRSQQNFSPTTPLVSVRDINEAHWDKYGRHMYCRCDYEEVDSSGANQMMDHIQSSMNVGGSLSAGSVIYPGWTIESSEEYEYQDPVDLSVAKRQGLIIRFENGSRLVYRLSGTGSAGATIRMYMEYFVKDWRTSDFINLKLEESPLMEIALKVSDIEKFTGRKKPNVIT